MPFSLENLERRVLLSDLPGMEAVHDTAADTHAAVMALVRAKSVVEDPALERFVRLELGKPFGKLTVKDLTRLRSLIAYTPPDIKGDISSLAGLQYAINVRELSLPFHRVSDLRPIAGLVRLMVLRAGANGISTIAPLRQLRQLQVLSLSENRIDNIHFIRRLNKLQELYLDDNQIADLTALANLPHLRIAGLEGNRIRDIRPLSGLQYLTDLAINDNQISDIRPLLSLPSLRSVSLGQNKLNLKAPLTIAVIRKLRARGVDVFVK